MQVRSCLAKWRYSRELDVAEIDWWVDFLETGLETVVDLLSCNVCGDCTLISHSPTTMIAQLEQAEDCRGWFDNREPK